MNGLSLNVSNMAFRLVRYGSHSRKSCTACVSFLRSFCTLCRVCMHLADQSCRALRYFFLFGFTRATMCCFKSQVIPIKVGRNGKGIFLDGFHGMSKACEIWSMSAML